MKKLLFALFFVGLLVSCSGGGRRRDSQITEADSIALSRAKGADMVLYNVYRDSRGRDTARALHSAELFLSRLDTSHHSPIPAQMHRWAARLLLARGEQSRAMKHLQAAYRDYAVCGPDTTAGGIANSLSDLYLQRNRLDSAFLFASHALDVADRRRHDYLAIPALRNMGIIFSSAGYAGRSDSCFRQCVALARRSSDSARLIQGLVNSSALGYLSAGKPERALLLLEESMRMNARSGKPEARIILNIAGIYVETPDIQKALHYAGKAAELPMSPDERAQWHKVMARIYMERAETPSVIAHIDSALNIYDSVGNRAKEMEMHAALSQTFTEQGDEHNALLHARSLRELQLDENRDGMLASLYSFVKDYDGAEREKQMRETRIGIIFVSIFAILLLSCVAAWVIYVQLRRRMQRKLKEAAEDFDRRVRNTSSLGDFRKEVAIHSAISTLEQVGDADTKTLAEVQKILRDSCDNHTQQELNTYIPYLDSERYHKFIQKHPNLTPNESRIVIFVALHISTKQISELTGQSISAINMAKQRLRRKLGLTNTNTTLTEYINSFHLDD